MPNKELINLFSFFNKGSPKKQDKWGEVNKEYKKGQEERNRKRLVLLEEEQKNIGGVGVDSTLDKEIEHQKRNISSFEVPMGRIVKGGTDISVPLVSLLEEVVPEKQEKKEENKQKKTTPFPFELLSPDFKKMMGFPEI